MPQPERDNRVGQFWRADAPQARLTDRRAEPPPAFSRILEGRLGGDAFDFINLTDDLDDLALSQDYIYRDGQLLATVRIDGAGETEHHFHPNHLGTPLLITNSEGGAEELHSYYPFGEELLPDQDAEPMKFTGHERDLNRAGQVDDLDYMHARYCSPMLARFLSVDPDLGNSPQPQSWNRYTYVRNNPLKYIDPLGRYVVDCTGQDTTCQTLAAQFRNSSPGGSQR